MLFPPVFPILSFILNGKTVLESVQFLVSCSKPNSTWLEVTSVQCRSNSIGGQGKRNNVYQLPVTLLN